MTTREKVDLYRFVASMFAYDIKVIIKQIIKIYAKNKKIRFNLMTGKREI